MTRAGRFQGSDDDEVDDGAEISVELIRCGVCDAFKSDKGPVKTPARKPTSELNFDSTL